MTTKTDVRSIWTELRDPVSGRYRSGNAVILHGRTVPRADIEAALNYHLGDGWSRLIVEVQHMAYRPRVKWCGRYDWSCDNEGEWHGHYFGVQHNDLADCCYTVVLPVWPWDES